MGCHLSLLRVLPGSLTIFPYPDSNKGRFVLS